MAGDWIKMRANLHENPKVLMIADLTGLDPFAVIGRLHRLWSWLDQHTEDGHAVVTLLSRIDALVDAPKFAEALRAVGWLAGEDGKLDFPGFGEHNGQTAKKRAQAAQRQSNRRNDPSRSCHAPSVTKRAPREEKRREDISPLSPPAGGRRRRDSSLTVQEPDLVAYATEIGLAARRFVDLFPNPTAKAGWSRAQLDALNADIAKRGWDIGKFDGVMQRLVTSGGKYPTPTPREVFGEIKKQATRDYASRGGAA